jgi:hypothetical protein
LKKVQIGLEVEDEDQEVTRVDHGIRHEEELEMLGNPKPLPFDGKA